jgi:carbamoyl-phosphate synthase large subunit
MVNSNPETVSTDFDASDRLYFEPLTAGSAEAIARTEGVAGAMLQFGGQTAVNLADPLASRGIAVLGSSVEAIDLAEDRRRFAGEMDAIGVPQPLGATTNSSDEALTIADRIGYPVLVRPSYVLGGRAMQVVRDAGQLDAYMRWARRAMPRGAVLVDKYLRGIEVEVDAVADGDTVVIAGLMRHLERAGVHSGDSFAVYPAHDLEPGVERAIEDYTIRIARRLRLRGLVNIQYVVHHGHVYVLEVNPRASRTVPMLSKVTGLPMVGLATRVMLGERLADLGWTSGPLPPRPLVTVKAPVFSMGKLPLVDPHLGPEMKSTGEVMGVDRTLAGALRKVFLAAGMSIRPRAGALLTIADADKPEMLPVAALLSELGCRIHATAGTADALRRAGLSVHPVARVGEPGRTAVDLVEQGAVELVVNTATGTVEGGGGRSGRLPVHDGFELRRTAVERGVLCLTSLDTALALAQSACLPAAPLDVRTIGEWRRG